MEHIKIMGIKLLAIFFTVLAIFGIFHDVSFFDIVLISVLTTVISYVVGDLIFLRMFGNLWASFLDFGLAFVILWGIGIFIVGAEIPVATLSLLAAFFITCCEPFLHGYIVNRIPMKRQDNYSLNKLQTEFAEEADVHDLEKKEY
ncbi:DUF2512 family protein [Ornithinibacillus sp. L9]|uniref:DUF2512 family protein n=1 Tax=Ornithinibacillus caprae TaxID=2678566 RepID=A0A6N8FJY1_9BACI|nr:DUF2512 family protein [Ornithinibacillus caprae]MUK89775.1 DUF2512 family protein [Ornithinibacillus caprae]